MIYYLVAGRNIRIFDCENLRYDDWLGFYKELIICNWDTVILLIWTAIIIRITQWFSSDFVCAMISVLNRSWNDSKFVSDLIRYQISQGIHDLFIDTTWRHKCSVVESHSLGTLRTEQSVSQPCHNSSPEVLMTRVI